MPALRRLAAVLLVSLWLPTLLHCRLEAAGLIPAEACCAGETAPRAADACADDACATAEGEFQAPAALKIFPPALAPCPDFFQMGDFAPGMFLADAPERPGVSEHSAAPPGHARAWVFVERAALPPRAP